MKQRNDHIVMVYGLSYVQLKAFSNPFLCAPAVFAEELSYMPPWLIPAIPPIPFMGGTAFAGAFAGTLGRVLGLALGNDRGALAGAGLGIDMPGISSSSGPWARAKALRMVRMKRVTFILAIE